MNFLKPILLITLIIFINILLSSDKSIDDLKKEKERIQQEIDSKDEEIKSLESELKLLRKDITKTTNNLNTATQKAIENQKSLISIEEDIKDTQKLLMTIEEELSNLNILINTQKIYISTQEGKIDSIQKIIFNIEKDFKQRTQKTYKKGLQNNTSWKNKRYLKRLNRYVDENDKIKEEQYQSEISMLASIRNTLEDNLKELEISLVSKKKLYDFKKSAVRNLISNKKKKENLLNKLTTQKNDLEKILDRDKAKQREKESAIQLTKETIKQLAQDKEKNKKRTDELVKIRLQKNKKISGNFSTMKGQLQWPVNGLIVSRFGNQLNAELHTITENIGIDIECSKNDSVISVMDGIISLISYIPGHGNIIIIDHGEEYSTVYANIEQISVYENQYISTGELIAKAGESNVQNKGVVHFEIWKKDKHLNPENWLQKK